jgi:amidophosphoribosyltransferase
MPTKEELMGHRFSIPDIEKNLGVDSLGYLSLEGMEEAASEAGPFCNGCFSGEYPAPLVDLDKGLIRPEDVKCC